MGQARPKRDPFPAPYPPMLASTGRGPFNDDDWIFEPKWDGYRILAWVNGDDVRLYSRSLQDLTARFAAVANALKKTRMTAILDGEVVAPDESGRPDFNALHSSTPTGLQYMIFDILYWQDWDLRSYPLLERLELLKALPKPPFPLVISEGIRCRGKDLFALAAKTGMEGIIAKRLDSVYESGERSNGWLKIKTENTEDVLVCGYAMAGKDLRALLLCVASAGRFHYAGRVGSGFKSVGKEELVGRLKALEIPVIPIVDPALALSEAKRGERKKTDVRWVRPELMVAVRTPGWTPDGRLRQPTIVRLRLDRDVKIEFSRELKTLPAASLFATLT